MNLDLWSWQKTINICAQASGLQVKYETENAQPRTDGTTIYLAQPKWGWSRESLMVWLMHTFHEIGHCVPEMRGIFNVIYREKIDMVDSVLGNTLNILDDYRQESFRHLEFAGKARAMGVGNGLGFARTLKSPQLGQTEKVPAYIEAMHCTYSHLAGDLWPECIGYGRQFEDKLSPEGRAMYDTISTFLPRITALGPYMEEEELQLAKDIIKACDLEDEDDTSDAPEDTKPNGDMQGRGNPEPMEGQEAKGQGEEGEGEAEGQAQGKGEGDEGEGKGGSLGDNPNEQEDGGTPIRDAEYQEGERDMSLPKPVPMDKIHVYPMYNLSESDRREIRSHCHMDRSDVDYQTREFEKIEKPKLMANKIRNLLQVLSQDKTQYGVKQGRIHQKNLSRILVGGSISERVFKQKRINSMLNVSVSVLVDYSGSMHGQRAASAAVAASSLGEVLSSIRVPHEIAGFTDWRDAPVHLMFKPFEKNLSTEQLSHALCEGFATFSNNSDGESVLMAANNLIKQRSKRKVLIVLSDGHPASSRNGDSHLLLKRVIEGVQKSGVEIYGIGIQSDAVENFYPDSVVLDDPSNLEKTVLNVIKNKILN